MTPKENLTASANILTDQTHLFCVTDLHANISAIQGLVVEGLATAVLVMVVASVWDARNEKNSDSVPIKFGLTVAVLATTVGPYTGCSMNPARSFAPALWNNQWQHHWVYWFGPIGGALISSFIYRTIFGVSEKEEEEEPIPEAVALNSMEIHKTEVKRNERLIRGFMTRDRFSSFFETTKHLNRAVNNRSEKARSNIKIYIISFPRRGKAIIKKTLKYFLKIYNALFIILDIIEKYLTYEILMFISYVM